MRIRWKIGMSFFNHKYCGSVTDQYIKRVAIRYEVTLKSMYPNSLKDHSRTWR